VGDLTINANRKNVLVIRDKDGKKEFGRIDMTDPAIFTSPYFYLRQNDVVYVEPNKAKKKNARYSQAQQYSITVFSSILSAISVITTVILAITK
jgi:polysaccharide export outer membrane protein